MPDLPVAAPDPADLTERERVWLAVMPSWTDVSGRGIEEKVAALLAERQQDKERIEQLEAALTEARPYVEWMAAGPRDAADDASTAKAILAQVDAALAVEEDAENG